MGAGAKSSEKVDTMAICSEEDDKLDRMLLGSIDVCDHI